MQARLPRSVEIVQGKPQYGSFKASYVGEGLVPSPTFRTPNWDKSIEVSPLLHSVRGSGDEDSKGRPP